jgi:hypothetical protein
MELLSGTQKNEELMSKSITNICYGKRSELKSVTPIEVYEQASLFKKDPDLLWVTFTIDKEDWLILKTDTSMLTAKIVYDNPF